MKQYTVAIEILGQVTEIKVKANSIQGAEKAVRNNLSVTKVVESRKAIIN